MDPIAHTFFGATLAETGLRAKSRYATATLLIGANLPDIDAVATFGGQDFSLLVRRGWTHGVLALGLLPLLLAGSVLAYARFRDADDVDARWLLGLAYLSVWSHPLLDFMNTYGVRVLMPFEGRWFYGDTLFIIDPWFWLLTASGVVLARSDSRRAILGWSMLAAAATALVMLVPFVPWEVKVGWGVGVAAVVAMRRARLPSRTVARAGLLALIVYIGTLFGYSAWKEAQAPPEVREVQTNPLPGQPLRSRDVHVHDDHYTVIGPDGAQITVPREAPDEVVAAALEADSIRGFRNWMRFPYWEKEQTESGWVVTIRDLRYVDPGEEARGIGLARVWLDKELQPVKQPGSKH